MSENNLPNLEENNVELNEEVVENEVVEEADATEAEETTEVEEMPEEAEFVQDEATEECGCDCGCDCAEEQPQWSEETAAKKSNTAAATIGIVAALILVVAGLLVWYVNKPLPMPAVIDITGETIGDTAEYSGIDVEDFVYQYHLPEFMTAETSLEEAEMYLPLRQVAVMNQTGLKAFMEERNIPAEITGEGNILDAVLKVFGINRYKITGDTPYALVEGEMRLEDYVGDVESFKTQYELGDEVTADTKWKEVRDVVLAKDKADYDAQQEAMDAAIAQDQAESAAAAAAEAAIEAAEAEGAAE